MSEFGGFARRGREGEGTTTKNTETTKEAPTEGVFLRLPKARKPVYSLRCMKHYAAILLILSALSAALISLVGDDSYSKMRSLEKSVELQREKNLELTETVQDMRGVVRGLRSDPRAIEKAARNELGLARPDEQIFVFEKRSTARGADDR